MSTNMSANYRVGIVGGTGYTGSELLRQLAHHPQVTVHAITSRSEAGQSVTQMFPHLRGYYDYLFFSAPDEGLLEQCDVVFFATPHGVAMQQAPELLKKGIKVIDLGADFRIQAVDVFEKWYQHAHQSSDILKTAVYGLPEVHRTALAQTSLVANPGCYPTTVLLGLLPLIEHQAGLIDMQSIIADCKSGVSGAGKKADATLLYAELSENFKAYGVAGHRHHPEILEQIHAISGTTNARLIFTPHLVPMIRGMFSTIYVNLTPKGQAIDLQQCYEQRYANEPFVDVLPANILPETRFVRGSNRLLISIKRVEEDRAIILVAQDNVVKGASGQAIQCMNILLRLPETAGLHAVGLLP